MADQVIVMKPYVNELNDSDAIFINHEGTLRQVRKEDADIASAEDLEEEVQAREQFATQERQAREQFEEQITGKVYGAYIEKSASGSVASFSDGSTMPMKKCLVSITPKQSGTGTPSPDNVRQISGWSSVSVYDTGKNLLEPSTLTSRTSAGVTATANTSEPIVSLSGTTSATFNYYLCPTGGNVTKANAGYVLPKGTYTFSARKSDGSALGLDGTIGMFYWVGESETRQIVQANNNTATSVTLTATDTVYITPTIGANTGKATNFDVYFQLELGSTATAYEPYTGTTTTTNLGRTVYGGTLDVVSGVLTVDRVAKQLTSAESISVVSSGTTTTAFKIPSFGFGGVVQRNTQLSSHFVYNVGADSASDDRAGTFLIGSSTNLWVQVPNSIATTVAELKAWLDTQEVILSWLIATPQTYTLTPTEVSTLLGENNVWADAGAVEVIYRADPTLAYQELANAVIALGGNV